MSMPQLTADEIESLCTFLISTVSRMKEAKKVTVSRLILDTPVEHDLAAEMDNDSMMAIFRHTGEKRIELDMTIWSNP